MSSRILALDPRHCAARVLLGSLLCACSSASSGDSPGGEGGAHQGSPSAASGMTDSTGPGATAPATGAGGSSATAGGPSTGVGGAAAQKFYGSPFEGGQYNLGPVDYAETAFHNACAPGSGYKAAVQAVEGTFLAGLWNGIPNVAGDCDSCIFVTTDKGKSTMLRVVTYGDTSTNSIDVSPDAYAALNEGEYPRGMTWQFAECPDDGPVLYEFQTCASQWWTSLWVRNARVPLAKVEVQSPNHASFVELERGTDGTLTDNSGFGQGTFTIRSTGVDGSVVLDTFDWPAAGLGSAFLTGKANFD